MKSSKQLIEERSIVTAKIAELSAKETLTDAEQTELRTSMQKEDSLDSEIETALQVEKRAAKEAVKAAEAAKLAGLPTGDGEGKEKRKFSLGKVIEARVAGNPIDGIEKELIQDATKEARSMGLETKGIYLSADILNTLAEKRAMSAGGATAGGNTIQTDKVGFFDALYAKRVLQMLGVKYFTGLSHNVDLTGLATGVTTAWAAETADFSAGDPTTASRSLVPHRLGAFIDMSNQLLVQNPALEGYVINSFMESIYVAVEAAYINGSGSAPTGLLGTSGIQSVAMGTNGAAPSLAKTLELVAALGQANADTTKLKFLINPKTESKLKQTPIDAGSGAMIMAYQQYFNGQPQVIDGKITGVTSNVPSNLTKGSSSGICSALICGEFEKSVIGQFGGMDMIIDPYSQAIGGKVRIVANTFWDVAFEQPAVFGAIPDILA